MTDHDRFVLDPPETYLVDCPACMDEELGCELCNETGEVLEWAAEQWTEINKNNNINL